MMWEIVRLYVFIENSSIRFENCIRCRDTILKFQLLNAYAGRFSFIEYVYDYCLCLFLDMD